MRVKIFGAGSIGNHFANACRTLGWPVDVCDIDKAALTRMKESIYPSRYGVWDDSIGLFDYESVPRGGYDLIFIGTPPDHHISEASKALKESPRAILIEKPLCPPSLDGMQAFRDAATVSGVKVFVGYNHTVGQAIEYADRYLHELGPPDQLSIDVEFREHWGGIFKAHPWLSGPADTYLGFSSRGGGASGEHSHAINLWQHLAAKAGAGRVTHVQCMMRMVKEGGAEYDRICSINLRTEKGLVGRCVQDVITSPARKWARLQGSGGSVVCRIEDRPGIDLVEVDISGKPASFLEVRKKRKDDFIAELKHIERAIEGGADGSPVSLSRAIESMLVIAAAHQSHQTGKTIDIDYSVGAVQARAMHDSQNEGRSEKI